MSNPIESAESAVSDAAAPYSVPRVWFALGALLAGFMWISFPAAGAQEAGAVTTQETQSCSPNTTSGEASPSGSAND